MKKTISIETKFNLGDFVILKRYYPHSEGAITYGRISEVKATLGKGIIYLLDDGGHEYYEEDLCFKEEFVGIMKKDIQEEIDKRELMLKQDPLFIGEDYFKKHKDYLNSNFGINQEIIIIKQG